MTATTDNNTQNSSDVTVTNTPVQLTDQGSQSNSFGTMLEIVQILEQMSKDLRDGLSGEAHQAMQEETVGQIITGASSCGDIYAGLEGLYSEEMGLWETDSPEYSAQTEILIVDAMNEAYDGEQAGGNDEQEDYAALETAGSGLLNSAQSTLDQLQQLEGNSDTLMSNIASLADGNGGIAQTNIFN